MPEPDSRRRRAAQRLFDVTRTPAQPIGPTIDMMGFTGTSDGTLYASGRPGPGTDLPDPVGLITSTDAGRTWEPVSRQGETDFHALAATSTGLIGYEGRIVTSADGHHWSVSADDVPAYNLAATLRGRGLQRQRSDVPPPGRTVAPREQDSGFGLHRAYEGGLAESSSFEVAHDPHVAGFLDDLPSRESGLIQHVVEHDGTDGDGHEEPDSRCFCRDRVSVPVPAR